jgi:hypothetical protein
MHRTPRTWKATRLVKGFNPNRAAACARTDGGRATGAFTAHAGGRHRAVTGDAGGAGGTIVHP